jgi:hypothetical protein
MRDNVKSFMQERFSFPIDDINYLLNISENLKCIYFEVPKVACSTIKRTLQECEYKLGGSVPPEDVHDKITSSLKSPHEYTELNYVFTNFFKFTFVRNPYGRILSCYLDKIVGSEWERERRLPQLGFKPEQSVSFKEFLLAVGRSKISELDIHWAPQTLLLGDNLSHLDFIGRLERFNEDFGFVLNQMSGSLYGLKPELKRHDWHKTNSKSNISAYYGDEEVALVQDMYSEDFRALNYSLDINLV